MNWSSSNHISFFKSDRHVSQPQIIAQRTKRMLYTWYWHFGFILLVLAKYPSSDSKFESGTSSNFEWVSNEQNQLLTQSPDLDMWSCYDSSSALETSLHRPSKTRLQHSDVSCTRISLHILSVKFLPRNLTAIAVKLLVLSSANKRTRNRIMYKEELSKFCGVLQWTWYVEVLKTYR